MAGKLGSRRRQEQNRALMQMSAALSPIAVSSRLAQEKLFTSRPGYPKPFGTCQLVLLDQIQGNGGAVNH